MPVPGLIQHKVQVNTVRDNAVLSMIETIPHATDAPKPVELYIVHLSTVQRSREMWDDSDPVSQLNDIDLDDVRTRLQCLPHVGKGRVWHVARYPLGSFLTCLCDRKISFIFGVFTKGILQFDCRPLSADHTSNSVMFIQSGKYRFAIDTKQIYQLRVAACGQHWQLELSSKNGTALVIFAADPFYPADL